MQLRNKKIFQSIFILLVLALGLFIGRNWGTAITQNALGQVIKPTRSSNNKYTYIDPLQGYTLPPALEAGQYKPLQQKVQDQVNQLISANKAQNISVYFRDLSLGRWVGINEDENYDPASLLKVPLMIAYFHQAETDQSILQKQLLFPGYGPVNDPARTTEPTQALVAGKSYTVEELIEKMIMYSDNDANHLLTDNIDLDVLKDIYADLGLSSPTDLTKVTPESYLISARGYARFLRTLYNVTYLDRDSSEKAMGILAKTDFNYGLVAGLPAGTKVAHKFGIRTLTDAAGNTTSQELHDCGVIYYPDHPYILCVMTRGKNQTDLANVIETISAQVYGEMGK